MTPRPIALDLAEARLERATGSVERTPDLPALYGGLFALARDVGAVVADDPSNDDAVALHGEALALLVRFERAARGVEVEEPVAA